MAIREHLGGWSEYRAASCVLLFAGMSQEPDLLPLLEAVGEGYPANGRKFCFPKVSGEEIEVYEVGGRGELISGRYGIKEPDPARALRVAVRSIDLVLVPGVAFGMRGERVGRGKGYFDRFLPGLRPGAAVVGTCFCCQIFESLPLETHDFPMKYIVCEQGMREF